MIKPGQPKGFALIYLIFIILALAGMGAAIYAFTASTTFTELGENNRNRAYQLAMAGLNFAAEQYAAGVDLNQNQFKNKTYTLGNSRGNITFTVSIVTGTFNPYYDVISIGTVNDANGMLLAKAQIRSGSRPNTPYYFPYEPPSNQEVFDLTMNNLGGFKASDRKNADNRQMVRIDSYVSTGGTHIYWVSFIDQGTYPITDGDNPACPIGFHTARVNEEYANQLYQSWQTYNRLSYDLQVKVGWYKDLQAAVSGLSFRWTETASGSGLFQGYGLSFMRYTYSASGCGAGYDYIPNSIKPPGLANKLLMVLWEQRVEGGVEKRRWLAYADLGTPASYPNPRTGNDLKVVGAQDEVDGLLNDDTLIMVRVKDTFVQGQRVNEIQVFYGDASPYYDGERVPDSVATNITRKRMFPQWIQPDLFPRWPSNRQGLYNYTESGNSFSITNFWVPNTLTGLPPSDYDFFTLNSASTKIGPEPPSITPIGNPVRWVINPAYLDPEPDPTINPTNPSLVKLLPDKATLRTFKFVLNNFDSQNMEVGLQAMGNLNDSNRVVAFDDFSLQILGR